jgi:translation initiation factor 5A
LVIPTVGSPCKVVEVHKSKTGKHGNAKMRFVGIDIYTRKKYEDWFPGAESVEIPEVKKYDIRV